MTFHVGQKIECISDDWACVNLHFVPHLPRKGATYHVRGHFPLSRFNLHRVRGYIWLSEIVNPIVGDWEPAFDGGRFRPVIERKTNISIFTEMLTPNRRELVPAVIDQKLPRK